MSYYAMPHKEEFYNILLKLMDLFPAHYVHTFQGYHIDYHYEAYLQEKGLNIKRSPHIHVCKTEIKNDSPILLHNNWFYYKLNGILVKYVIKHHTVNGKLSISMDYPWPFFNVLNTNEYDNFWLCPNPLPELQKKIVVAIFGKEWKKYIEFTHEIHVETKIEIPIQCVTEKLL